MTRPPDDVIAARRRFLLDQESAAPEWWWWLSFADDDGFLGVVIVRAPGFITAIERCHRMGVNPGGEVQGYPCPDDFDPGDKAGVLLSRDELDAAGWI